MVLFCGSQNAAAEFVVLFARKAVRFVADCFEKSLGFGWQGIQSYGRCSAREVELLFAFCQGNNEWCSW